MGILRDVALVVPGDEVVPDNPAVDRQHGQGQREGDEGPVPPGGPDAGGDGPRSNGSTTRRHAGATVGERTTTRVLSPSRGAWSRLIGTSLRQDAPQLVVQ